jgi:hypothetical protein
MWRTISTQGNQGDFQLLVVGSRIDNLIPDPSFGHNLHFKYPNGSCKPISNINVPRAFRWYKELFNPMTFNPCNRPLKMQESIGNSLGNAGVHSLTLSCTLGGMKCDSQAHFWQCTFANPCLDREPKARITTL